MIPGPALLFCPADRPDRVVKAAERADAVIIDFEDGVLPQDRPAARRALATIEADPTRVIVRVNPVGSSDYAEDIRAVLATPFRQIMLAKTESLADVEATPAEFIVWALCETAAGVVAAADIARHERVSALMWGAEDLVASLGGLGSRFPDGQYRDVARTARGTVLLAAGAAGKAAVDAVHLDIDDEAGLRAECEDALASGFTATACIHPAQVAVIRDAYRPSPERIAAAQDLLATSRSHAGAFRHRGAMVDEVVLRHARRVLERAGLTPPS